MYRRLSAVITAAVATGTLLSATPATPAVAQNCWNYHRSERVFAAKVNHARASRGIAKLERDKQLTVVARRHSYEMAKKNNLYHTPDSTLAYRVTKWRVLGENIGVGSSIKSLHRAFMDSAPHRANLLYSSFRHVGVGVVRKHDRIWVTFVFESAIDPGTTLTPHARAC